MKKKKKIIVWKLICRALSMARFQKVLKNITELDLWGAVDPM